MNERQGTGRRPELQSITAQAGAPLTFNQNATWRKRRRRWLFAESVGVWNVNQIGSWQVSSHLPNNRNLISGISRNKKSIAAPEQFEG